MFVVELVNDCRALVAVTTMDATPSLYLEVKSFPSGQKGQVAHTAIAIFRLLVRDGGARGSYVLAKEIHSPLSASWILGYGTIRALSRIILQL
jgi:hypothetical protein